MQVLINKRSLGVTKFASTDQTRPTLCGVHISEKGIEATDSYRMARVTHTKFSPEAYPVENSGKLAELDKVGVVVPAKDLADAGKRIPKSRMLPVLNHLALTEADREDRVGLTTTDLDTTNTSVARIVHGAYPDFDQLLPKDEPVFEIGLNAAFLKEVAELAEKFASPAAHPLVCKFYGPRKPAIFEIEDDDQTLTMLLMPVLIEKKGA